MSDDLRGKTALVTGAAKRIGAAISRALAREGANVVIHYSRLRRRSRTPAGRDQSRSACSRGSSRPTSRSREEYETLIERSIATAGSLDMLVNNASLFPVDSLATVTFESLVRNMQVNAWVPFVLEPRFRPSRRSRQDREPRRLPHPRLRLDARRLHPEQARARRPHARHGAQVRADITVNGVAPGLILPPPGEDESYIERLTHTVPLKRHGSPEDIAEAVVYLLKSDFVTGETIAVDGGRHLKEYESGPRPDK